VLNKPQATVGSGAIEGAWDDGKDDGTESYLFWQHVRLAGLAPGSTNTTADDYAPVNAVGGRIGIQSAKPFTGINGTYFVCSTGILGKYAKQLDIQLDDGNTATGSMMAGATPTITAADPEANGILLTIRRPTPSAWGFKIHHLPCIEPADSGGLFHVLQPATW
jgi:hypothetical protein